MDSAGSAEAAGERVRVVIADDHTLVRDGLCCLLSHVPDMEVVGEVGDGGAVVDMVRAQRPDAVLLDAEMPGPSPSKLVPQIAEACSAARVVILTGEPDPYMAHVLMNEVGAYGYLVKDVSSGYLVEGIRAVMKGRTVLAASAVSLQGTMEASPSGDEASLSDRELEVLQLLALGMTNRDVARQLSVSEGTVRTHLHNLYRKLGADGRLDAVTRAAHAGLIGANVADLVPQQHPANPRMRPLPLPTKLPPAGRHGAEDPTGEP